MNKHNLGSNISALCSSWLGGWRSWLPSRGNVLFTLVIVGAFFWVQNAGALPFSAPAAPDTSTGTIAYQGRLADAGGNPLTDTYPMVFRLYNSPAQDAYPLWEENWTGSNSVQVSDGLFNVMLGSLTPISQTIITGNGTLWLGISVDTDGEMVPRVQLGSVPFAVQANTVLDGSITTDKIVNGAVTQAKLGDDINLLPPAGSITTTMLADNAVTASKLAAGALPVYSASTTRTAWSLPSCGGDYDDNSDYHFVPGLTFDVTVSEESTLLIDFTGLGFTRGKYKAIYSTIFVDGARTRTSNGATLLGGCRNSDTDTNGPPWCTIANSTVKTLTPGTHTIKVGVFCDGTEGKVHSGWLRAVVLP
jgi:hypothetical protein